TKEQTNSRDSLLLARREEASRRDGELRSTSSLGSRLCGNLLSIPEKNVALSRSPSTFSTARPTNRAGHHYDCPWLSKSIRWTFRACASCKQSRTARLAGLLFCGGGILRWDSSSRRIVHSHCSAGHSNQYERGHLEGALEKWSSGKWRISIPACVGCHSVRTDLFGRWPDRAG